MSVTTANERVEAHALTLVVPTTARVAPELVAAAVASAGVNSSCIRVMIPCVLPPTLPISAVPPRLSERLVGQRTAAVAALEQGRVRGRVQIAPCRSVQSAIAAVCADSPPDQIVLAGPAPWTLRRALRGLAPVRSVSDRARQQPAAIPVGMPALGR